MGIFSYSGPASRSKGNYLLSLLTPDQAFFFTQGQESRITTGIELTLLGRSIPITKELASTTCGKGHKTVFEVTQDMNVVAKSVAAQTTAQSRSTR